MYLIYTDENDDFDYYIYDKLKYISIRYRCKLKTGLNILNIDKNYIYYLSKEQLKHRCCYIRLVKCLNNTTPKHDYYSSYFDKIILSDRYYLYDPKTVKKFNLQIDANYISGACYIGSVSFLEWWLKSGLELKYSYISMNSASQNGHVNVLEWWLKSGLELKYDEDALNLASQNGHVNVLEWWLKSGLELKYDERILTSASAYGHVKVLKWWVDSKLLFEYRNQLPFEYRNQHVIDGAYADGREKALEW